MMKSRVPIAIGVLFCSFICLFVLSALFAPSVDAGVKVYPNPTSPGHQKLISAKSGDWGPPPLGDRQFNCSPAHATHQSWNSSSQTPGECATGLDATVTRYKLFKKNTGVLLNNTPLLVKDGCKDTGNYLDAEGGRFHNKPNHPDKGARKIKVEIWKTRPNGALSGSPESTQNNFSSGADCDGADLRVQVPRSAFTLNQRDRYGNGVLTALVVIQKGADNDSNSQKRGNKLFTLDYQYGDGVYGDDSRGSGVYFAQASTSTSGTSTYTFVFKTDCRYRGGDVTFYIGDADWGDGTIAGKPTVSLYAMGDTMRKVSDVTGGSGNKRFVRKLDRNKKYILEIENVGHNNGLRFYMPFSEFPDYHVGTDPNDPNDDCGDNPPDDHPDCPDCIEGRAAACSVTGPEMVPGRPNSVIAGQTFDLNGIFRNRGDVTLWAGRAVGGPDGEYANLPTDRHNYGLRFHNNGSHRWGKPEWALFEASPHQYVEPGMSVNVPIRGLVAPSSVGTHTINVEPDHFGWYTAGGFNITACPITINVYEEYRFDTSASRNNADLENPTQINYGGGVKQVSPPNKSITATVRYGLTLDGVSQVDGATDGPKAFQGTPPPYNRTYAVSNPQFGQKYCATLRMSIGGGSSTTGNQAVAYVGPDGTIHAAQDGVADDCYRIENRPYVRAYGGDVAAGGGFLNTASSCGVGHGGSQINAYMRPFGEQEPQNKSGSGSQLAAMALGNINGFMSAALRSADPVSPKGLTFAHEGNAAGDDSLIPPLGGNLKADNGWCVPNFFEATQFPDDHSGKDKSESTAAINVITSNLKDGGQTVRNIGGKQLQLNGIALPVYNRKHAIYVNGDVFINNDIMYTNNYAAGTDSIPSFTLVVRGNIYINSSVRQLDGLYIAQPAEGREKTGRIYACANASGAITGTDGMFNTCGASTPNPPQLRVNGAFIAERVVLNRTGYTLRDSKFRELANDSKAAEIFNFSPELYLSPPVFRPNSTPISGDYDYISILAPTL